MFSTSLGVLRCGDTVQSSSDSSPCPEGLRDAASVPRWEDNCSEDTDVDHLPSGGARQCTVTSPPSVPRSTGCYTSAGGGAHRQMGGPGGVSWRKWHFSCDWRVGFLRTRPVNCAPELCLYVYTLKTYRGASHTCNAASHHLSEEHTCARLRVHTPSRPLQCDRGPTGPWGSDVPGRGAAPARPRSFPSVTRLGPISTLKWPRSRDAGTRLPCGWPCV